MSPESFSSVEDMVSKLQPSYPVYCLRHSILRDNAERFLARFPGDVLYAVKCNPHPEVLKPLHAAGVRHFDTASLTEIAQISEMFTDAKRYYMHPVKPRAAIRTACEVYHVKHYVIDHRDELDKVIEETRGHDVVILVRMATPSGGATYELSRKFGAPPEETVTLLKELAARGTPRGIAFHVGSQCVRTNAFETALDLVANVCSAAGEIDCLDVGGGFPAFYEGTFSPPLETFLDTISARLEALPIAGHYQLMCEPGRAMVANSMSLVVQVQLRKDNRIYINDGIYGSLSEAAVGGVRYPIRLIDPDHRRSAQMLDFTVNGPTCDSVDVLPNPFRLPDDVCEGDWIEVQKIGAYSNANRTQFNGFFPETLVAIDTE
jgi:ornithine decarboxylase